MPSSFEEGPLTSMQISTMHPMTTNIEHLLHNLKLKLWESNIQRKMCFLVLGLNMCTCLNIDRISNSFKVILDQTGFCKVTTVLIPWD